MTPFTAVPRSAILGSWTVLIFPKKSKDQLSPLLILLPGKPKVTRYCIFPPMPCIKFPQSFTWIITHRLNVRAPGAHCALDPHFVLVVADPGSGMMSKVSATESLREANVNELSKV